MEQHILLVEDDQAIADSVIYALKKERYEVAHCLTGKEALLAWDRLPIQVGILDVGLPDMSGFDLCKKLKSSHPERPILFLTAQNDEIDRIVGLELGADDYLGKPFSPRELVLRVKAILRRSSLQSTPDHSNTLLRHDKEKKQITCNGIKLPLTKSEYLLLSALMDKPGRVFTRDNLLDVLGEASNSSDRAVDTHIKELRAKLKKHCEHELIITHRGLGYSLDDFS